MPRTPRPHNETERLKALHAFEILDSLPELQYDDLTKLAAALCGCPSSVITFVDHDRQWFKSTFGIQAKQTPREGDFCAHAILEKDFFIVKDAQEDVRFAAHPLVVGAPHIRFYAAAPVTVEQDLNVGVICVIDTKPRTLDSVQIESLQSFSRIVSGYLEARKKCHELAEALRYRDESQKLLHHAAQMSALAQMSGSMAHEINNPIAIVLGLASQLKEALENGGIENQEAINVLQRIEKAGMRVSKIIKALRTFSRDGRNDPTQPAFVQSIVENTLELCRQKYALAGVEIRLKYFPLEIKVECREVQISQVLLNLLNNSFDAVQYLSEKWIEISVEATESGLQFSVTDSGLGILLELRERVFHPFFTTKEVHQGTGLGLSICKGILESHKSQLQIDQNCTNTRFIFTLPLQAANTQRKTA